MAILSNKIRRRNVNVINKTDQLFNLNETNKTLKLNYIISNSELSPLQTRSARKKKEIMSSQLTDTVPPTLDNKALRALKALARTK
jgi:hypothetical protein